MMIDDVNVTQRHQHQAARQAGRLSIFLDAVRPLAQICRKIGTDINRVCDFNMPQGQRLQMKPGLME